MGQDKDNESYQDTTMWMVTFGDLLMLLLTFFVMLLTMSSMDTKALKSIFSIFQGGFGPLEFSDMTGIKQSRIVDTENCNAAILSDINQRLDRIVARKGSASVDSLETLEDFLDTGDDLDSGGVLAVLKNVIDVTEDERGVTMTFQANLLFDSGEAEIKPAIFSLLDAIAKVLSAVSNQILIMGHSDNIPIRSKRYRSNWELSLHRALNVHRYFIQKDISPKRLAVGGYGDSRPQFPNDTKQGRDKNRRVEVILRKT